MGWDNWRLARAQGVDYDAEQRKAPEPPYLYYGGTTGVLRGYFPPSTLASGVTALKKLSRALVRDTERSDSFALTCSQEKAA